MPTKTANTAKTAELDVLLLGANGQVGRAWSEARCGVNMVAATDRAGLDLADLESLGETLFDLVQASRPNVIVNAAAYTAVDRAEDEEPLAYAVNALAPGIIASVAANLGLPLVHYSTDYVFDGHGDAPFVETDAPAPLSAYGRSKLAGERAVQAAGGKHLILRTSWVFSMHGQNFLKTMLHLAQTRDQLRVVNDQIGAPTPAELLVRVPVDMLRQLQGVSDPRWGLYHLCPAGYTSWHGYAVYLIERARAMGWPIRVAEKAIIGIESSEFPVKATRPLNSRLATDKLQQAFDIALPDWQAGVDQVLQSLESVR
ncbi:dTDP-4-dehydrorhamnose reductase [Orrella daihaiensis]|uniref:dTDP-4-dehydrorhamnose reductase n=1 Tax=Orrella daihaiensis TaxID=2782176 RepID=A0ABY4AMR4_9BURK|nr:dTDP-4-dehydrorhamnose reductase [Orrella daihaiensis]UOD50362.1 dTDP-4-dehydrorhamnose reductase [Orrella daihaiensis]